MKRLFIICLIIASLSISVSAFSDIDKHWAKDDIMYCVENGIMNGFPNNTFRPNEKITEQQFFKIISKLMPKEMESDKIKEIGGANWYEPYYEFLENNHIATRSYSDDKITREQAFALLGRLLGNGDESLSQMFSDSNSIKIKEEVGNLVKNNLINGDNKGKLNLKNNITRAELCKIISKMLQNGISIDYDFVRVNFINNRYAPRCTFYEITPFSEARKKSYESLKKEIDKDALNDYFLYNNKLENMMRKPFKISSGNNSDEYRMRFIKGYHDTAVSIEALEYYSKFYGEDVAIVDQFRRLKDKIDALREKLTESDEEKTVKNIHDWIVDNCTYAYDEVFGGVENAFGENRSIDTEGMTKNGNSVYQGITVLEEGRAACQGYTECFQILANACNLENYIVHGEAKSSSRDTWGGHAWNLVKVNGNWYHVDTTWDDPLIIGSGGYRDYDNKRYKYYLVSDSTIKRDHRWTPNNEYHQNYNLPESLHDFEHNYQSVD